MFRPLVLSAAALAMATSAQAATQTGPYVGAAVTVDSVDVDLGIIDSIGATGVGGSAFAGYNVAVGNGVFIGTEANIDVSSAEAKFDDGVDTLRLKARWGWGVGARIGYDINASTAAYLRGGYARNQVKLSDGIDSVKEWGDGVRVGGGLETVLSGNTSLRAEYNYVNYEAGVSNNQGLIGIVFGF